MPKFIRVGNTMFNVEHILFVVHFPGEQTKVYVQANAAEPIKVAIDVEAGEQLMRLLALPTMR